MSPLALLLRQRYLLWFFLLLLVSAEATGQPAVPIDVQPGATFEREFGAATLIIHVSEKTARVDVSIRLMGQTVSQRNLTPAANIMRLDLQNGEAAIHGDLFAHFGYPQQRSALSGDFKVTHGPQKTPFRGDIAIWQWPVPVVRQHWTVWLTPELNAEVDLLLDWKQTVQIQFETAGQVILTLTLAEGANLVVSTQGYNIGTVHIEPGMTLRLQPSTPIQKGEVFLQGVFSSSNHPEVKYAGALVTWAYLPPPGGTEEP